MLSVSKLMFKIEVFKNHFSQIILCSLSKVTTVTSRLFTHIVSIEKMRKDMRGTNLLTILAVF